MDSPLMPTLRGMPRDMDESFADMSLASAHSPMPPPRPTSTSTSGSTVQRPAPTRAVMEEATPREYKSRQSVFPAPGSTSRPPLGESSSSSRSTSANPQLQEDRVEIDEEEGDVTMHADTDAEAVQDAPAVDTESRARREERLKDSLYELRGINDTFEVFLHALESARGHNERLAKRVKETSSLLDKYTALLGQTEHTHRLLSNPNWTGAEDDQRALEAEQAAKESAEREELRRAEDAARREEEEREQREAAAAAQAEAARAKEAARAAGGSRGRGLPTRGGGTTRGRGSGIPAPSTRTVSGGRPPPTVRKAPSGLGLAGQYANVKSSGYGPSRKAT